MAAIGDIKRLYAILKPYSWHKNGSWKEAPKLKNLTMGLSFTLGTIASMYLLAYSAVNLWH